MKQKRLFVLCAAPGCGKSTWAHNKITEDRGNHKIAYISRDEVRFSLLQEGEKYFSHEIEVFLNYTDKIQTALDDDDTDIIIADATHLNQKSRNKLISCLSIRDNVEIYMVIFNVSLDICLAQNARRRGTRAFVPEDKVADMFYSYSIPKEDENPEVPYHIVRAEDVIF